MIFMSIRLPLSLLRLRSSLSLSDIPMTAVIYRECIGTSLISHKNYPRDRPQPTDHLPRPAPTQRLRPTDP